MNRLNEMRRQFSQLLLVALAVAVAGAVLTGQNAAPGRITAFEGARVITADGRAPIENATVVVDGTRIVQVGPSASVKVPAGAAHVSLTGKTIMPAIVDTHTHLSQTREMLLQDLTRRAYFGVGAVQSLGQDNSDVPLQVRNEVIPGAARFFSAGRGITGQEPGRSTAPYWVTSPDMARMAVRELAAKKVSMVKIWVDDRMGAVKKLTPDIYGAAIDEAHKQGLRTIAHVYTLDDAKGLLRAGIDAFAHGVRDKDVDAEFIAMVKQHRNLVLGPNMPDRGVKIDYSWLRAGLAPADYEKVEAANKDDAMAHAFWEIQARNLKAMNGAGVKIVLGTDGNTPWAPHVEMQDMVAAGMTPMQVLVAATRNGAEFLRIADAGTIAANKSADFIVLDANPIDDITNTRKIAAVYLRGQAVSRDGKN